jgi:hypothetical protein
MASRRSPLALAGVIVAVVAVLAVVVLAANPADDPDVRAPRAGVPMEETENEEAEEQAETVEEHREAVAEALEAGTLGKTGPIRHLRGNVWAGEVLAHPTADDWEPAIATDPDEPWVYVAITRFGYPPCAKGNCPDPSIVVRASSDGGRTWGDDVYVCECVRVHSQFDPILEAVTDTGEVYAVWMNDWNIVFSRSSDHGVTWSEPVPVYGNVSWGDKPAMTTSSDGQDVYVSFNGPTGGDVYVAASHDAGATWEQVKVTDGSRYYFAYSGVVGPDGRVTFAEMSETYTAPGGASEGPVFAHAITSDDGGATWTDVVVDEVDLGVPCTSEWCYADFYDGHTAIAGDADGDLVMLYDGATRVEGPRRIWARSSTDGGLTWGDRVALSPKGANAGFPAAVGLGDGQVRAWFMDQRTGRWNVWFRSSRDLGQTWTTPIRISDAVSGTAYKDADGFTEAYGDYGEIAITSDRMTVAVWGESISYRGPGGVWFNRQRAG